MSAIEVDSITVRYGAATALSNVSLNVSAGEVCGLVGVNGSGKSTLLKAIVGQEATQSGEVRILGARSAKARRNGELGYLPQFEAIDWTFPISVREVVMAGRSPHQGALRRRSAADQLAVDLALDAVEMRHAERRQIGMLSGGQRKRVFLARCLAQRPKVLLLDEPFAGVDRRSEELISAALRTLAADGVAVLVSTHDLANLGQLADSAVLLNRTVMARGTPESVLTPDNLARVLGWSTSTAAQGAR